MAVDTLLARPGVPAADGELLLTGATGLVGSAVLAELLASTRMRITCLVRADSRHSAHARVRGALAFWRPVADLEALAERVRALPADLERDDLGLDHRTRGELASRLTHAVHCAASVRFDNPLATARGINVEGAAHLLGLALEAQRYGGLRRVVMVSTAFVGGTLGRPFSEDDLDVGQSFRNTYERSKFEAEQLTRRSMEVLPVCVVRPSVVVGRSDTGRTSAFNVLYAPLRLFLRHTIDRTLPLRATTTVDTVPVDWAAQLITEAALRGRDGRTYAAAAGRAALTVRDLADLASDVFDTAPRTLLPAASSAEVQERSAAAWSALLSARERALVAVFGGYFAHESRFDAWRGDGLMRAAGLAPPDPRDVLRLSLEYARATSFGRVRPGVAIQGRPSHTPASAERRAVA